MVVSVAAAAVDSIGRRWYDRQPTLSHHRSITTRNRRYLAPYTAHPVRSLAEFSALSSNESAKNEDHQDQQGHQQQHRGACFGAIALLKVAGGMRSRLWMESADRVRTG